MNTMTVNGKEVPFNGNETILTALKREGIKIPTLCHIEGLPPTGACRICVVEDAKTGVLIPSCSFPATDKMSILTHSPKVIKARKTIVNCFLQTILMTVSTATETSTVHCRHLPKSTVSGRDESAQKR